MLSMTNFQPSGIRPVSRESNDPSNRRRLAVRRPTALRKADLAQYLTALSRADVRVIVLVRCAYL